MPKKHTPISIPTVPLPRITVAIVPSSVAQLVIPGDGRESIALAFRIAARAMELLADIAWSLPYVGQGNASCVTLRIEAVDAPNALDLADRLEHAAVSVARDAAGFATHRIERIR